MLKIRVMNTPKKDLSKISNGHLNSISPRCSRKSTKKNTARSAARRIGALIGDYEFGNHPQDMALLEKISQVAAAAHAPFISRSFAGVVRLGHILRYDGSAGHFEDLRPHGICEMALFP